jgi:hypothetical protein
MNIQFGARFGYQQIKGERKRVVFEPSDWVYAKDVLRFEYPDRIKPKSEDDEITIVPDPNASDEADCQLAVINIVRDGAPSYQIPAILRPGKSKDFTYPHDGVVYTGQDAEKLLHNPLKAVGNVLKSLLPTRKA